MTGITIIVVGGGVIGLLTAHELAAAGARVQLIERSNVGRASSWAGGGILSPLYPWRYPDPVNVLARWSQAAYPELVARLRTDGGVDAEWTANGMLMLDTSDSDSAQNWAERFGYDLERLDAAAVQRCEPALGPVATEGLWLAAVAQLRNPRLVQAARNTVSKQGVTVRESCAMQSLLLAGGRIVGVRTTQGELQADAVVVTAGAWTGQLLADLAVRPDIRPVRGQMLLFHGAPGMVSRIILGVRHYVIPRRDGRVLVGSTMEEVGFDDGTTAEARAELEEAAFRLVPGLRQAVLERHWAGLRPGSPTGVPYIGEHPQIPGLFINSGHFRNGVVMAPASARLLADLVLQRAPILDPAPFALRGSGG